MCDYSLTLYQTRPARAGETYFTHRFPTGAIGLTAPGQPEVAVCVACDTRMTLRDIPEHVRKQCGVGGTELATFVQLDGPGFRDAVRFDNGETMTLQSLGAGVTATVTETLEARPGKLAAWETEIV